MLDILCIGAHPDDIEVSMAGTILKLKALGYKIGILDLTNGEPTPFGTVKKRLSERDNASKLLLVDERITLDLPNRYLQNTIAAREKVAIIYRKLKPKIIFTHYPEDSHPDHIAASKITTDARFFAKLTKTDLEGEPFYHYKIFYHSANHLRLVLKPAFIINISEYMKHKIIITPDY
mgnify:CR=1 FL=1